MCGVDICKQFQFVNWMVRPIPTEMLEYASEDVRYLLRLKDILMAKLNGSGMYESFAHSMARLQSKSNYVVDMSTLWKKIKFSDHSRRFISRVQAIAALREEMAMAYDIPRRRLMSDNAVVALATELPVSMSGLKKHKISSKIQAHHIQSMLSLCAGLREGY
jgi:ribonuclease D